MILMKMTQKTMAQLQNHNVCLVSLSNDQLRCTTVNCEIQASVKQFNVGVAVVVQ